MSVRFEHHRIRTREEKTGRRSSETWIVEKQLFEPRLEEGERVVSAETFESMDGEMWARIWIVREEEEE